MSSPWMISMFKIATSAGVRPAFAITCCDTTTASLMLPDESLHDESMSTESTFTLGSAARRMD